MRLCGYSAAEARDRSAKAFAVFFEARQRVVFYPGALETLELLAGAHRLGALTNGNADIEAVGLGQFFSFAYSSADVGISKPAPDMFHAALRHADVTAADTIHVGDNLVDDIAGAGQLGIHTIWTNHADESASSASHPPSATVDHLDDLPAAVDAIKGL
jgi:putative hydrolase of the HAD superfamily